MASSSSKDTPNKSPGKRKDPDKGAHVMETRTRKKARQTVDFLSDSIQRAQSQVNLLGENFGGPSESELKMIFRVFDRNNDGKISSDELVETMKQLGKRPLTKKVQKILDACDAEKSGFITLDKFVEYFQAKAKAKATEKGKEKKSSDEEAEPEPEKTTKAAKKKGKSKRKGKAKKKSKGKAKTAAPEKVAEVASESTSTTSTTSTAAKTTGIARGSSILHFYTENAGIHENKEAPVDQYNNPKGAEYDLGREGAFTEFSILVGMFFEIPGFDDRVGAALKAKGFKFNVVKKEEEFVKVLSAENYNEAWIIPNNSFGLINEDEFANAVVKFHESGGGLFLWGDNEPFLKQTNVVLQKLFGGQLRGSDYNQKVLKVGSANTKGEFGRHLITSGLQLLYEGHTVAYFDKIPEKLEVLATSSENHAVILVADNSKLPANCGRVLVDSGFTKLYIQWDTAGTERYVKNASVWLLGLDHRFLINAPLLGVIEKPTVKKVYMHGTWHSYDEEASDMVEKAYQEWVVNKYTDIRSVASGTWKYQVDFNNMQQTNIQHEAHTQRKIQRIEVN